MVSPRSPIDFLKGAKYVSKYDYNLITKCLRVINLAGPNFAGSTADLGRISLLQGCSCITSRLCSSVMGI